jgi:branched-chain amino acid transport system permease protein
VLLVAVGLWAGVGGDPFIQLIGQSCAVYAIAAVGQWLLVGRAGQIALSGAAFMAIGAFTTGLLGSTALHAFPLTLIISAVAGWVVGLAAGLPGLRFRGLYLLLASLALQFIVSSLARSYQNEHAPAGIIVPPLSMGSLDLSIGAPLYFTIVAVLLVVLAVVWVLERTGVGLAWRALRESEVAAAISGIDVTRWKLYAFAASGAITAVAGCLFAYVVGLAEYATYDLTLSISLITMLYIGGIRSRLGALLGAVVITALPYVLQQNLNGWLSAVGLKADWYTQNVSQVNAGLFSLLFLLVVLFSPRGLEGLFLELESLVRRVLPRRTSEKGSAP